MNKPTRFISESSEYQLSAPYSIMRVNPCFFFLMLILFFTGCRNISRTAVNTYPSVFPDYINVTIPCNIAPLNFRINGRCDRIKVKLSGKKSVISISSRRKAEIPIKKWRNLLDEQANDSIQVNVEVMSDGEWQVYKPFCFYISGDSIDEYLSYRLIEPGYEVWKKLQIAERDLGSFREKIIADNNMVNGLCMNCHVYDNQNPATSFFHLRGKNGGTMVQKSGIFRKLNTATDSTISSGVYGSWHPSGRYIAFSSNVIIPEFHSTNKLRIEVYDTVSDIILADIDKNEILKYKLLSDLKSFETFPEFSHNGKKLFFCSAKATKMPQNYKTVRYSLCAVDFDPENRVLGSTTDTLISAFHEGKTVSEPKASPDGKYILYTSFDYGNFPVWHKDADLHLLNLEKNRIDTMPLVNSDHADSYHSWSSNSRWIVFASKRANGMYGMLYFAHIDANGRSSKAFLLPQKDPDHYDFFLKSYNIPELAKGPVLFNSADVEKAFKTLKPEQMRPVVMR